MKDKLMSDLVKLGIEITESGHIKRSDLAAALTAAKSDKISLAKKIALGWACDFIAAYADLKNYRDEFIKPEQDILETIPNALSIAGLCIDNYLDVEAATKLMDKINLEWDGKVTLNDLVVAFGDDVLNYVSFQAAGLGTGLEDFQEITAFLQERGVSNFKIRMFEPGRSKAQGAISDFENVLLKKQDAGVSKIKSDQMSKEVEYWVTYRGGYEYGPFDSEEDAKYAALVAEKIDKQNVSTYRSGVLSDSPQSLKDFYQKKADEIEDKLASRKIKKLG